MEGRWAGIHDFRNGSLSDALGQQLADFLLFTIEFRRAEGPFRTAETSTFSLGLNVAKLSPAAICEPGGD